MGGALAIPIIPNGGYQRFAPPPTLQFHPKCDCFDPPQLAAGRSIDLDQFFSRTVTAENSDMRFSGVKIIGEKL